MYVRFLDADSSATSFVNAAAELDDVPHEYADVWEVDMRDTGNVITFLKHPVTHWKTRVKL